ncbi:hypothetical protein Cob_v010981 [Colletotrichum orbiculare MAFF 240422]|uniref:Uncharacterized protein n=1 Tax=Colletotrichum orbiculare (strain 104-T / ATCC 96160 / CBS 514.97 / LARS 414 / MAFF 240422) TaxID=1213857 RepID=A0A484FGW1_COLOR|nr:hypothetical protein Cob_v010981 [Colletotrichum orbiculare MAFF 240422]
MRSSVILFVASLLIPLSAAVANIANPDCIRSRDDPTWVSNCGPEDQKTCRSLCEGTCQTMDGAWMATPEGTCDCWCS